MFEAGVRQTGDPFFARRVGENTLRQHAGTQVATVLRTLGSTEAVLEAVTLSAARLSAVTKMDAIEAAPGRGVVRARAREGFTRRRLHCAYATACDLVSTDDLDAVLRRIVERAADAVRAPSHILAVRTEPSAELQVYSHGIDAQRAKELATATLAQEDTLGDSTLFVEV